MKNSSFYIPNYSLVFILLIPALFSCSPTRRLSEGEYLLQKSKIELESKALEKSDLQAYQKQSPNKQILGVKFHLFLYNLAKPNKDKGISGWLKRIGEQPVVYNPILGDRTAEQFKQYLETKGYYHSKVEDTAIYKGKKVIQYYEIDLNEPFLVNSIKYQFEDQTIKDFILNDTTARAINPGDRFDKELLQQERQRIETNLKNWGFYQFTREYIFFEAKQVKSSRQVNLTILIKENVQGNPDPTTKVRQHHQYKIQNTYLFPNYSSLDRKDAIDTTLIDTIQISDNNIIYYGQQNIRPEAVLLPNRINPGDLYSLRQVQRSYSNYASLGLYRLVNINMEEIPTIADTSAYRYLNCYIRLSPRKSKEYQVELVGTNTTSDLGARVNIKYDDYNVFRGAENLQVKLTGALEQAGVRYKKDETLTEGGIETTLTIPKFLLPLKAERFSKLLNTKTLFNASYNYQKRPGYERVLGNTSLSYRWKSNRFTTYQFYPIDFNYVWLPSEIEDTVLLNNIRGSYNESSFTDHTILAARLSFDYTNKEVDKETDYMHFRVNLESAGNVIYGVSKLASLETDTFMNVPYFRYLRSDFDFRIHNQVSPINKLVYRVYAGLGYPQGNSVVLPFERSFFSGGPNGIRAWETRSLGPGSDTTSSISYVNRTGDIKLEANFEYRFKLFWVMEGAFFIDAGNIWTFNEIRPGTDFKWNRFYKEIAVGTGIGTRFDFSFLMIRIDFGYKMRDPGISEGNRWIDFNNQVNYSFSERFNWQFGIGYPF